MHKRSVWLALFVTAVASMAWSQAPQLECSFAPMPAAKGKGFEITLTNTYNQDVTAYTVLAVTSGPSNDSARTYHTAHEVNAVPIGPSDQPIPAHGHIQYPLFTNSASLFSMTSVAVIYADGETTGDSDIIDALMAERGQMEADYEFALPLLANLAKAPDPEALTSLSQTFKLRAVAHEKQLRQDGPKVGDWPWVRPDRVCRNLGNWLPTLQKLSMALRIEELQRMAALYQQSLLQLQISRPHVSPPS